jgi:hypothetical protein
MFQKFPSFQYYHLNLMNLNFHLSLKNLMFPNYPNFHLNHYFQNYLWFQNFLMFLKNPMFLLNPCYHYFLKNLSFLKTHLNLMFPNYH